MACPKCDNSALIWYLCYNISYFNKCITYKIIPQWVINNIIYIRYQEKFIIIEGRYEK